MDPASTFLKLTAVLVLIGLNALFVAARFALVSVRRSRVEPLARGGDRAALRVLAALDSPDRFTARTLVAISLITISIGLLVQSALQAWLLDAGGVMAVPAPGAGVIATLLALIGVVLLHSILGDLVPRMLAAREPEGVALRTFGMVGLLTWPLRPLVALATFTASGILRLSGREPAPVHPPVPTQDEIRALVEQAQPGGTVESEQEQMLLGVIQLRDTLAREVMTPRRDIIALPVTAGRSETLDLVSEEGHSRIPVYAESIDDIVGVLLVKDLLTHITRPDADTTDFDLRPLLREPYFVPDTKRIGELLPELRTKSVHMAIVLDEFGGTDGLVTLEDMLEEIVGDIYDEHDVPEDETDFEITDTGVVLIDGGASVFDVNERFGLSLPEEDYDTVGGFVFGELGRVPVAGDVVPLGGAELHVDEVEERRVTRVRLVMRPEDAGQQAGEGEEAAS